MYAGECVLIYAGVCVCVCGVQVGRAVTQSGMEQTDVCASEDLARDICSSSAAPEDQVAHEVRHRHSPPSLLVDDGAGAGVGWCWLLLSICVLLFVWLSCIRCIFDCEIHMK
jgi:hypothetical protein